MNYGISVLFRAIPLAMALFCFFYGGFIYFWGDDSSRMIAGPVVFFLGSICLALYATAVTIIRQIIGTYSTFAKYFLPIMAYAVAIFTFVFGTAIFSDTAHAEYFVAGHVVSGLGLITGCVATAATVSTRFKLITGNSADPTHDVNPEGFSLQQELIFETVAAFFAVVAWAWTFILLGGGTTAHFVAGSVMGGIACICTSLIALVASIVRQERNVYSDREKKPVAQTGARHGLDRSDLGPDRRFRLFRTAPGFRRVRADRSGHGLLQHIQQGHPAGQSMEKRFPARFAHSVDSRADSADLPVPCCLSVRGSRVQGEIFRPGARNRRTRRHLLHALLDRQHTGKRHEKAETIGNVRIRIGERQALTRDTSFGRGTARLFPSGRESPRPAEAPILLPSTRRTESYRLFSGTRLYTLIRQPF